MNTIQEQWEELRQQLLDQEGDISEDELGYIKHFFFCGAVGMIRVIFDAVEEGISDESITEIIKSCAHEGDALVGGLDLPENRDHVDH